MNSASRAGTVDASHSPSAPHPRRAQIGRYIGIGIFHTAYRGRAQHAERVPLSGPVILVANHAAFLDGPFVFSMVPRPVNFLVKQEAFTGFFGAVIAGVGQIPIDRSIGDRGALATAAAVLERGGAVGIFPEGNRGTGNVDEVNQGAAWLALRTGAALLPVAVMGTRTEGAGVDAWPRLRSRLDVVFGSPFELDVPSGVPGRERLRLASEQLRETLASHVRLARVENGPSADFH
ncbi:glycerol acyltransferase [Humibacillus sp. DSM 29435]|uniref:lysophospholipid acyltransferase family protein n=1 Tax=Humibacillus sp. DSM 29435 TaxID=1869167 RepID=UPI000872AADE|nr:lysophospholipid acyltransferase family protein [Humibacillus sp. DSM 29435]OFE14451.1 glycerol acyltransferase [Humibacillus sp. DSM 29435]